MKYQNLEKRQVLIADDDESNRILLTFLLEEEGWEVSAARDGREAIEKVLKEQPNLLILDYWMPELTGGEVYQNLKSKEIKLATVLISSDSEVEQLVSSLGIDYYLPKPFDISDFLKTINSAYENSIRHIQKREKS